MVVSGACLGLRGPVQRDKPLMSYTLEGPNVVSRYTYIKPLRRISVLWERLGTGTAPLPVSCHFGRR